MVAPIPTPANRMLVTLTVDELKTMIAEAVAEALSEFQPASSEPLTVSGSDMAARLGVSRSTMHAMRVNDGCPAIRVGDHYRYEPSEVMVWLRARSH